MKKLVSLSCIACLLLNLVSFNVQAKEEQDLKTEQSTMAISQNDDKYESRDKSVSYADEEVDRVEVVVEYGKVFEIYNNTPERMQEFIPRGITYNCIIYNTLGYIKETRVKKDTVVNLLPGEKMRVTTATEESMTITMSKKVYSSSKFVSDPLFEVLKVEKDKNYEFRNESDYQFKMVTDAKELGSLFDIVIYDGVNKVSDFFYGNNNDIQCIVNSKFRISANSGPAFSVYIPYEYRKFVKEVQEPAIHVLKVKNNETYELKGDSIENTTFKTNGIRNYKVFDTVKYDQQGFNYYVSSDDYNPIKLGINEKARMTFVSGDSLDVYMPYEFKSNYKKVSTPALQEVIIKKGESGIFTGNDRQNILTTTDSSSNGNMYDIVGYDSSKNVVMAKKNAYTKLLIEKNKNYRVTTTAGVQLKVHVPYESRSCYKVTTQPALFGVNMKANEYYEVTNTYGVNIATDTTASAKEGIYYDFIKYKNFTSMDSAGREKLSTIKLGHEEKIKIGVSRNNNMFFYVPYEYKDMIKKVTTPIFAEFEVNDTNTYRIHNSTSGDMIIVSDTTASGDKFKLSILNGGDKKPIVKPSTFGDFKLAENQSADVQLVSGKDVKFFLPYGIGYNIYQTEDVNKDEKIDMLDISKLAVEYNKKIGDKTYTAMVDLNYDGIVDVLDLILVAKKISK